MNTYVAFYGRRQLDVEAETSLQAREKAADLFKARKRSDVSVLLVAEDGVPVLQQTSDL